MGYIRVPIETNPQTLAQDIFDYIQTQEPNWTPADGNLDTWIIRAVAAKAAENRTLASDVPDDIYADFGSSLMAIPPIDDVAATGNTTWTLIDVLGHTIPAGTFLGIRNTNGDLVTFQTLTDVVVPPGSNTTAAGEVQIMATDPGTGGNDLSGTVELIDVLAWVDTIVLTSPTGGGVDAETIDDYLSRLTRKLQALSTVPIVIADFASAALDADPGVFRAVAIDMYDPVLGTYGHDRTVTIAAVDAAGNPVSNTIKTNIKNYIESLREVNFVINVMDANYTEIDVAATIKVLSGFDAASVEAAVEAALTSYLDPANWGQDPNASATDAPTTWVDQQTVYYNELIVLVGNTAGVDRVTDLTVNVHGGAATRADVALTAPASLTTVGTITATAV